MQDRELYRQILGIESPWKVVRVELRRADGEVHVFLEHDEQVRWPCRQCSDLVAWIIPRNVLSLVFQRWG